MTFNKRQIVEFKSKGRKFLSWQKKLKPHYIRECFYNGDEKRSLKVLFPDKDLEYCYCYMYDIVAGDYQLGIKYVNEEETYYMFLSANSFGANPQDIAVGKAVDGKVYLINEHFPNGEYSLNFIEIPEEYINKDEKGFRPKSYNHSIFVYPNRVDEVIEKITDEDMKCLKIAYEGILAFSNLIAEIF